MSWRIIKQFPKYALVLAVLLVSTGLFGVWWYYLRSKGPSPEAIERQRIFAAKVAALPEKMGWIALVGNDLYDISTGEKIFSNWLGGMPLRLFYQKENNKLMVLAERGVIRYGLDGKKDGAMAEGTPPVFTWDGTLAAYIKDGDIWLGETDWKTFRLVNERQVTKYGKFMPAFFAANIKLISEKALIVRQMNDLLKVDLKTGDIKPVKVPQYGLEKARSPDGHVIFGKGDDVLSLFDVDKERETSVVGARERALDFQWLDNDRCALLNDRGKTISIYDRRTGKVEDIAELPFTCEQLAQPSTNGSYVLTAAQKGVIAIDVIGKKAVLQEKLAPGIRWTNEDSLTFARDVPDTSLRGTWFLKMGETPRLIMSEPYIVSRDGQAAVATMTELQLVIFATKDALYRMKLDGTELHEIAKLTRPVQRILTVEIWGN